MNSLCKKLLFTLLFLATQKNCCGATQTNIAEGTIVIAGITTAIIKIHEDREKSPLGLRIIASHIILFASGTALFAVFDRCLFSSEWNWWHNYLRANAMVALYGIWGVSHRFFMFR
jgi:hypothetical protein